MSSSKISLLEKATMLLVLIIVLVGYTLLYTDGRKFELYVHEDGVVEWLTVVGLLAGCFLCLRRFIRLFRHRNWWFLVVTMFFAIMLLFAAGEEISWGQRILGITSPEFFKKENTQQEINLHNLVVNGVKINKLIFSIGLIAALVIYLGVMPILYVQTGKIKKFVDFSGFPVPQLYQVVCFLLLFASTSLLRHEKNSEILECGAALLFFLIILSPKNSSLFTRPKT